MIFVLSACFKKERLELVVPQGGDFEVSTHSGSFKTANYRGKILFVFFGFLNCPYVCPKTLSSLYRMYGLLSEEERSRFVSLFITVDPLRDPVSELKKRMEKYPPNFLGATTTSENLDVIMKLFGASYHMYPADTSSDFIIDHSTSIYVVNSKGQWVASLSYDTPAEILLETFRRADHLSSVSAQHRRDRFAEIIAEKRGCDLSNGPCQLEGIELSVSPLPITVERQHQLKIKLLKEDSKVPSFVDIQGIDINMGLIRPELNLIEKNLMEGTFYLPSCESPDMNWRATVISKDKDGQKGYNFYFTTKAKSSEEL
jgi:protein SCO1